MQLFRATVLFAFIPLILSLSACAVTKSVSSDPSQASYFAHYHQSVLAFEGDYSSLPTDPDELLEWDALGRKEYARDLPRAIMMCQESLDRGQLPPDEHESLQRIHEQLMIGDFVRPTFVLGAARLWDREHPAP